MDILPAIDLLEGSCVRLIQGRYDRVIDYQANPIEVATRFREDGATRAHVIDLDGARQGSVANIAALRQIVADTGLKVQFGGGVREREDIQAALDAGAERVIVGTRALENWEWFREIVHSPEFAGRIALGSMQGWVD
jgi:phosphoribosylformimino-5-aminoimidazole carboxamide ribotide isomerase